MTPEPTRSTLVRAGFVDVASARTALAALGEESVELMPVLSRTADPDHALEALVRLVDAAPDSDLLLQTLRQDEGVATRLLNVLGASTALADHLVRHPHHWQDLRDPAVASARPTTGVFRSALLSALGADPADPHPVAGLEDSQSLNALRVEYRRLLIGVTARDLGHEESLAETAAELSDLAAATLDAALAVARARVGDAAREVRLSVVAMGKCGGHELNYVSDVDVIFVHEAVPGSDESAATRVASQLASHLMQACSDHTAEGTIWPVDAGLRPEGNAGTLVRTLASHQGYYERWAKTWEFQALLKARPVAGDLALGARFVEMVQPLVWQAAERDGFVIEVQAMRRRVLDHIPSREAERQLKLGAGGLRDVEFAVQLLQLVHGRADERLRGSDTLGALAELIHGGYVGRADGEALRAAYTFLRSLEHRMQLHRLRRVHVVPEEPEALRRLGRSLGMFKDSEGQLLRTWRDHRREVRRLHEKLFYRPLLRAVARIPGADSRLTPGQAEERLAALGYVDPKGALRHLEALTSGVSRTAEIQRTLLPVLLVWFADSPDPDAGLFGFRRISESLGSTHWYLRLLRDEGEVAERLARVLSTSRYATDLLEREPNGVRLLGEELASRPAEVMVAEMTSTADRQDDLEAAVRAIRAVRRRELLRIAVGDLVGEIDVLEVGSALTTLTDATLEATLRQVVRYECRHRGLEQPPTRLAIVAVGRYGGFELSYGSDADVLFVHEPTAGADPQAAASFAHTVANEVRRLLGVAGSDPALQVDADLRPEGRQGPLVRTLGAYQAYYAKWSKLWETQALLRADAVVGDEDLRRRFTVLIDPIRYPADGLDQQGVREIRRIKARVDDERLPRGADRHTHFKLGRGGLADIEWTIQLLQLQHGGGVEGLRTPRTVEAATAAQEAGLLSRADADELVEAWRLVSRVRNAATLVRGAQIEEMPSDARERAAIAQILGYQPGSTDEMVNDYLRVTRRAHAVVERVFWG